MLDNKLLDGEDDFVIFVPGAVDIDLTKGGSPDEIERLRPIGGTCSTERLDRQDETVFAKGLDFSEFVNDGWFNDNHSQATHAVLGTPTLAELRNNKWWTEGNLLVGYPEADRIWNLAKALTKSMTKRRLGFSIEGKVQERGYDNRILKAKIRHVAITNSPVNVDCTWDILAKSFAPVEQVVDQAIVRKAMDRTERSNKRLSFDQTVMLIKSVRPHYEWATCERVARVIHK